MINDYLVRWSTANHHNVATQLMHQKTHSFAIQNQASHVIFNSLSPEERAVGVPNPPLINPRHNHNAPWHSYEVWSGNLVWSRAAVRMPVDRNTLASAMVGATQRKDAQKLFLEL
jgi:hypothetical protein